MMAWNERKIKRFVRDRDTAFTNAVLHDDWDAVADYLEKYKMHGAQRARMRDPVIKAAIYKAVHECTNIPEEVKLTATAKCISLGFKPRIDKNICALSGETKWRVEDGT